MTETMVPGGATHSYRVKGSALGLAIFVLSGMYFLAVLDGTVVFVAMPAIQDALNLNDAMKVWVFGAYALTFGGFMLLGGRLGDTFGRKRMFVLGVAGFTVASALAGFAQNEAWMLAARASQGLFAAIACPTALALIATTFAPGKARNQAFATFGAMAGLGSVVGLVAGGILATWDWRLVFWINVPIGLACAIGGYLTLEEATSERRHALDIKGAVLAVSGCVAGVYALTAGPELHWQSPLVYAAAALSVVCLVAFLYVERTAKNPILPFSLFNNRNRVATMIAILVCGALIPTLGFYVALTFQLVLGYSAFQSGLALLPFAVGFGISVAISATLVQRFQARWLVAFGGVIVFLPCVYVPTLMDNAPDTISYFPQIAIPVLLIGVGVGFAIVPLPLCALAGVRPSEVGPMSALVEVGQNLGGIIGLASVQVAVTSRIMAEGGPTTGHLKHDSLLPDQITALASGYGLAFLACAVILILAGIVVVPFMRFTPAEIAEGKAAEESSKSGGAIPSTSFPAQAFVEDDEVPDDWEPLEGDVTSGSFQAISRVQFDRAYNEKPDDPEPVYFTDRFRAINRPAPSTRAVPVRRPGPPPQSNQAYSQPDYHPDFQPGQRNHPSDPLPRRAPQPGEGLAGVARESGPINRESADLQRPPGAEQHQPPLPPRPAPQYRPSQPVQRPSGQLNRPGGPGNRPSAPINRPSAPTHRPSVPVARPSGPVQRPNQVPPHQPQPSPSDQGRHALPDDGMHRQSPSPQADRVSRARRHRRDDA